MNNKSLRIGFIGGGNMAHAIIGGLIRSDHQPDCILVSDPDSTQCQRIKTVHADIQTDANNSSLLNQTDVIVLAVKPQILKSVIGDICANTTPAKQTFISIAAGITLDTLSELLAPASSIIRIMPNQPALVGAGMSVLVATDTTGTAEQSHAEYVAAAMGDTAWITDEKLMDAVTAVSGSGPAYFYLLMEAMEACAKAMGLPADLARQLARQTGYGAGLVAAQSEQELASLRASVTSKGGTTAAALQSLEAAGFHAIVEKALQAAKDRSIELGQSD